MFTKNNPIIRQTGLSIEWTDAIILLVAIAIFGVCAGHFAYHQSLWIDETTQLTGLGLSLEKQLAWLTGHSHFILGVPDDRMPPLSYWLGSLWASIFGLSEISLRWMGIVAVCCAAPALYFSARLIGGVLGGVFILGIILFSSRMIIESVEIRAYPLFFLFSSWAIYFFVLLIMDDNDRNSLQRVILLCCFLLLAIYTHFFGILAAACILTSLFFCRLINGQKMRFLLVACITTATLSAGIIPFIISSMKVSDGSFASNPDDALRVPVAGTVKRVVQLFLWTVDHPSLLAWRSLLVLFVGSFVVLIVIMTLNLFLNGRAFLRKFTFIMLPLILAYSVLIFLSFFINAFDVLAPSYNLWTVPLLMLTPVFAFTATSNKLLFRIAAYPAGAIAICCNFSAAANLSRQASLYSHGPSEWVASYIKDPNSTLIIHDGNGSWGFLYFPLYFITKGRVTQWLSKSESDMRRLSPNGFSPVIGPEKESSKFTTILVARTESLNSTQIAAIANGSASCDLRNPNIQGAGKDLDKPSKTNLQTKLFCAYVATSLLIAKSER